MSEALDSYDFVIVGAGGVTDAGSVYVIFGSSGGGWTTPFNLGNLYDERGLRAQAMEHYLTALRISPRYPDAHYNVALLYQNMGESMKAVRHWKAYLRLDPNSSWSAIARRELEKLRSAAIVHGRADGS